MVRVDATNLRTGLVDPAHRLSTLPDEVVTVAVGIHPREGGLREERCRNIGMVLHPMLKGAALPAEAVTLPEGLKDGYHWAWYVRHPAPHNRTWWLAMIDERRRGSLDRPPGWG